jgi:hypothetical protein
LKRSRQESHSLSSSSYPSSDRTAGVEAYCSPPLGSNGKLNLSGQSEHPIRATRTWSVVIFGHVSIAAWMPFMDVKPGFGSAGPALSQPGTVSRIAVGQDGPPPMPKAGTARRTAVIILIMTVDGNGSSDCEMADCESLALAVKAAACSILQLEGREGTRVP